MALYDDIGGAPAVRAALNAFYARVLADAHMADGAFLMLTPGRGEGA